ncbi:MAG: bifunctional oligoribonuclease/PAP phosphatase NrnA [Lentisphaeria bacterium]|jgi:phosphoesterase RecJ-like protein|nr:bifunctional oligoribonuclease/PAP phosphatase NrnA [Lentisphaeria bacterium]
MKTLDFADLLGVLRGATADRPVLVVTHERPDGDAIGSSTAMTALLKENGIPAVLYLPGDIPDCYTTFVPADRRSSFSAAEINASFSCVMNVDASTVKRLGLGGADFSCLTIPVLTLDHHPDDEHFGQWSYVDPGASSSAEIVFRFARAAGWTISPDSATKLLLGITTDTGCFRFSNTSPAAHRAAAELIEQGADNARIIDRAYLSKPFNMAMFEAELFRTSLRTAREGAIAWFFLSPDLLRKYSVNLRNTEQLIEVLRGIEGVRVAALLKPTSSPGIFKLSLRSRDPRISVGRVARRLNGGGHEMAAGGTIFAATAEEAEAILLKHVEQEFQNEKQSG